MGGSAGATPHYFSEEEVAGLSPHLVEMLDHARGFAKIPFRITSGLRTADENRDAGGVWDSAHTRGLAVDLACYDSRARMRMVAGLIVAGFSRIGLYTHHIHADVDDSLPGDVLWLGGASH